MEHMAYWKALLSEGKLVLGGQAIAEKEMFGVLILNAASREAATEMVNADPVVKAKVFRGEVIPFRTVFKPVPECGGTEAPRGTNPAPHQ